MNHPSTANEPPKLNSPPPTSSGVALPFFLALAVLFAMAYGGWKWWQVRQFELSRGQAIPVNAIGPPLAEFDLTERSGEPFSSTDMRGKVWVATYFFTTCPGSCLRLNQNIQRLNGAHGLKDVVWVSITCDPDTDTLVALRDYADRWKADPTRWLFCRGELEYIQRVAKGMSIALERKGHQDYAVVFDKTGAIRGMYDASSWSECENRLLPLLLKCLDEPPPQEMAVTDNAEKASG